MLYVIKLGFKMLNAIFFDMFDKNALRKLGQTHENRWSRVIASRNEGSTNYIFPFRLRVLQRSRHLLNY